MRATRRVALAIVNAVTRIIAGGAGSIALDVPDAGTRPTSDRVRESLFAALESADALRGATVLDLYAGSGALGLEAASRGAASVDLVEKSARAVAVIRRNSERVGRALSGRKTLRTHRSSVSSFLRAARRSWNLVFLDPPYDQPDAELTEALTLLQPVLDADATVVVERAARSGDPSAPAGLRIDRGRRYGDTAVWWLRPDSEVHPRPVSQSR